MPREEPLGLVVDDRRRQRRKIPIRDIRPLGDVERNLDHTGVCDVDLLVDAPNRLLELW
jgi:hypothetical protein